jgi:hypothetical protein
MRKILLPPLMIILLVACGESGPTVPASQHAIRHELITDAPVEVSSASGLVLPAAYASTMGEVNNIWPHSGTNIRYQQVFLGSELGDMDRIAGLCLRHDNAAAGRELTKQLTLRLGPTQLDNTNLGTTFSANYSDAPTEVFSGDVTIPATTGAGTIDSFDFCIEFTTQYLHPAGSNLIVEFVNTSVTTSSHPKDACSVGASGCTTRRVLAFSASATTATFADNSGLIMQFLSADPTEKVDCTEGRWIDFGFRNQGQCIRFVETEKDSRQ